MEPVTPSPKEVVWADVTEGTEISTRHGEDWVTMGIVFHRLFEDMSKGVISPEEAGLRARVLLDHEKPSSPDIGRHEQIIMKDMEQLASSGLLREIILPQDPASGTRAYTELPFILQKGPAVYKGRIDRVLIREGTVFVYDYKTFPVSEREVEELKETCEAFGLNPPGKLGRGSGHRSVPKNVLTG